jgi:hypothetical protein
MRWGSVQIWGVKLDSWNTPDFLLTYYRIDYFAALPRVNRYGLIFIHIYIVQPIIADNRT